MHLLSAKLGVEMPICEAVYRILEEGQDPRAAVGVLMARETRAEAVAGSPMELAYRLLNVFTLPGDRLSGNPLCVFEDGTPTAARGSCPSSRMR